MNSKQTTLMNAKKQYVAPALEAIDLLFGRDISENVNIGFASKPNGGVENGYAPTRKQGWDDDNSDFWGNPVNGTDAE